MTKKVLNFRSKEYKNVYNLPETTIKDITTKRKKMYDFSKKYEDLISYNALKILSDKYKELKQQKEHIIKFDELNLLELGIKDFLDEVIKNTVSKEPNEGEVQAIVSNEFSLINRKNDFIDILNTIIKMVNGFKVVMSIGSIYYTFNENTIRRLFELIKGDLVYEAENLKSDDNLIQLLKDATSFTLTSYVFNNTYKKYQGGFFKYYHNTHIDLKKYQIFSQDEEADYTHNCLIYALIQGGLDEEKVNKAISFVNNRIIPTTSLNDLCKSLQIKIIIKIDDNGKNPHIYGKEYTNEFHIGLLNEHYFIIDNTNNTSYSIQHYNKLKDIKDYNYIFNKQLKKSDKRVINSFNLIKLLLENANTLLTLITLDNSNISKTQYHNKVEHKITNLKYDELTCCKSIEENKKIIDVSIMRYENVFFDVETYPFKQFKKDGSFEIINKPYICSMIYENGNKFTYDGDNCVYLMLCKLYKNTCLIAHNASFDYHYVFPYLFNINEITRGNSLICLSAKFKSASCKNKIINIKIKDSYKLIPTKLSSFPKMFGIVNTIKEVMPYNIYNQETIGCRYFNIKKAITICDTFTIDDTERFLFNIKEWGCFNPLNIDEFDIIKYSIKYCEMDCYILKEGYLTFKKWINEAFNINVDDVITLASLANRYLIEQGCYQDVFKLSGVPHRFIQQFVVGGRTMVSNNKKVIINEKINDFDGVSLYPSAMNRMTGFLKGKPKVIPDNFNYQQLCDLKPDGFFVEVLIKNLGIKRDFPLISYINNNTGVRHFTNDVIGKTVFMTNIALEDAILFQNIEFDIIRGYYFNEGVNNKVNDVMLFLFNKRKEFKENGNKIQEVYKLIMNNSYGITLLKEVETETNIFDNREKFYTYLNRNYNYVSQFSFIENSDKVKCKSILPINEHFNIPQVGTMILDWSKRIMNEVMCLADDLKIPIYYQDTDSMHILDCKINELALEFYNKYNRKLIGKNLGQFHNDFEFENCNNIVAIKSIFLGKKAYIDKLEGINKDGNIETKYHFRLKGIPSSCVEFYCKNNDIDVLQLFEKLYNNEKIVFDLTNKGSKVNFKYDKNNNVKTLDIFTRTANY